VKSQDHHIKNIKYFGKATLKNNYSGVVKKKHHKKCASCSKESATNLFDGFVFGRK
jgi:hypothetical protein